MMFQAANEKSASKHEKAIGDNCARDRGFDEKILPGLQSGERNNELRQVTSVALSSPPTASPVFAATDSVARLKSAASGTIAAIATKNNNV